MVVKGNNDSNPIPLLAPAWTELALQYVSSFMWRDNIDFVSHFDAMVLVASDCSNGIHNRSVVSRSISVLNRSLLSRSGAGAGLHRQGQAQLLF